MKDNSQITAYSAAKKETLDFAEAVPLFREINNLKRIRAAQSTDSLATLMFERAWGRICGGAAINRVAVEIVAEAVIAVNLGAIDSIVLKSAALGDQEVKLIRQRAFKAYGSLIEANFRSNLLEQIESESNPDSSEADKKTALFVENLKRQPRSGATKIGAPKRIFDAPENHAEHCLAVAVIGALVAPRFDASIEKVFLVGLAHHFHNAYLPDSGFAGEQMLGEFLPVIFESFRNRCLEEVPENLREMIRRLFREIETADSPEAKAFHTADVFDRVLQMMHHAEENEFTLRYAMEEVGLVHEGAVQTFHYDQLRAAKLIE